MLSEIYPKLKVSYNIIDAEYLCHRIYDRILKFSLKIIPINLFKYFYLNLPSKYFF